MDVEDKGGTNCPPLGGKQFITVNTEGGVYSRSSSRAGMWTLRTRGSRNATPFVKNRTWLFINEGRHVDEDDKKDALIQGPLGGTQRRKAERKIRSLRSSLKRKTKGWTNCPPHDGKQFVTVINESK